MENVNGFKHADGLISNDRQKHNSLAAEAEVLPCIVNAVVSVQSPCQQEIAEKVKNTASSSEEAKALIWNVEKCDPPEIPMSYVKVAQKKFQINVVEFFAFFFSDDSSNFAESFHKRCGDTQFECSQWHTHKTFGHARELIFLHPIKVFFGTKYGSCKEVQKFRMYQNSHFVIETSQDINDVPLGDCFQVQGLWNVYKDHDDSNEACILEIYVNVAFTKNTFFKGKIIQSTIEECREAYCIWVDMAHDFLMRQNFKMQDECTPASIDMNSEESSHKEMLLPKASTEFDKMGTCAFVVARLCCPMAFLQNVTSILALTRSHLTRLCSALMDQSQISQILIVAFAVVLMLQISILALLNKPQGQGAQICQCESSHACAWLDQRVHHLHELLVTFQDQADKIHSQLLLLKLQLEDLNYHKS